jgi:hypothetical protein
MSAAEKRLGGAAVFMALCCALLPLLGGAIAGGLAAAAGTIGVVAAAAIVAALSIATQHAPIAPVIRTAVEAPGRHREETVAPASSLVERRVTGASRRSAATPKPSPIVVQSVRLMPNDASRKR